MDRVDAKNQYLLALRSGQRYYRDRQLNGGYPYPQVLDEILDESMSAGRQDLGIINIPSEQIVGTKTAGRMAALAGNFMPLLKENTEFAMKWISLCEAHLGPDGIHESIKCYEYMGRFYVEEGNKRVSVLKSYRAPTIPGHVIRILPCLSDDREVRDYYSFLRFYECSRLYSVRLSRGEDYQKLLSVLGCEPDKPWTEAERRSFSAGFSLFNEVFESANSEKLKLTAGDALLVFLQVYDFQTIKKGSKAEIAHMLSTVWGDLKARALEKPIEVRTEPPAAADKSIIAKILGVGTKEHLNIAFIYGYETEKSEWTRAHAHGQEYIEKVMGSRITVRSYKALDHDYESAMALAVAEGAEVIFATTPQMILSCRKTAAENPNMRVLNCSISQPYTSIRSYYARIYEAKFITGALAGAIAQGDSIGYIANYPIVGVPASINAFALGARLTNPRARIKLLWSCTEPDPLKSLILDGITVISNREASDAEGDHWAYEWGTYKLQGDGSLMPLAVPCWDWGRFYERVIFSFLNGSWDLSRGNSGSAINYWWGMNTGVIDVQLSPTLPDGMKQLANILRDGIIEQRIEPFRCAITDQNGVLRNNGADNLSPDGIINMDWLCDNVEGGIPSYEELNPLAQETVRVLGLNRCEIPPETEEAQL